MNRQIIFLFLLFISHSFIFAQTQKATTESGIKVILNSDGTWDFDREKTEQKKISILDTIDCSKLISSEIDKPSGKSEKYFLLDLDNDVQERLLNLIFKKSHKGHLEMDVNVKDYSEEGGQHVCIKRPHIFFLTIKNENIKFTTNKFQKEYGDKDYDKDYCDGFTIVSGGVYSDNWKIQELMDAKVKMIRVYYDYYLEKNPIDFFLTENEQEDFWIKLNCLYK